MKNNQIAVQKHNSTRKTKGDGSEEKPQVPVMKKVGNYLINLNRQLGQGQYGKVYLAEEVQSEQTQARTKSQTSNGGELSGSQGNDITKSKCLTKEGAVYCACKVVERNNLDNSKEQLVVSEIQNQDSVESKYVVKLRKAIKTDSRYYMFMDYCNGGDMKDLMELKQFKVDPRIIQKIMQMIVMGFNDMMQVLVIHRDLKLQNIMLHFPQNDELRTMNKEQKKSFLREVNLLTTPFEIKIADFGFSKKLKRLDQINKTICGTPLYMAPQVVQKTHYSYKADIWSIGVILFELLNTQTPFHAKNRPEFENKVKVSSYNLRDACKDILTLECILFLSQCLQHNEIERKGHEELLNHPYIVKNFDLQMKIGQQHIDRIFSSQNELTQGSSKQRRPTSATPLLRRGDGNNEIKLTFNAKDKNQLKMIQNTFKQEHGKNPENRPSGQTGAETERVTGSGIGMDRFKSGLTSNKQEDGDEIPITTTFNLTNQKNVDDNRLTVNNFAQANNGVNPADMASYRNKTVNNPATLLMDDLPNNKMASVKQDVDGKIRDPQDERPQMVNMEQQQMEGKYQSMKTQNITDGDTASMRLLAGGKQVSEPGSVYRQPSDFNSVQTMTRDMSNIGYDGRPTSDQFQLYQYDHQGYNQNQDDRSEQTIPSIKTPTVLAKHLDQNPRNISEEVSLPYAKQQPDNFANDREKSMQEIRDGQALQGSLRQSRQKKTIRKTNSPSGGGGGGGCFSIFKCCDNTNQKQDVESRIERKKTAKRVQVDTNPEVIDVSEQNRLRLQGQQSNENERKNRFK